MQFAHHQFSVVEGSLHHAAAFRAQVASNVIGRHSWNNYCRCISSDGTAMRSTRAGGLNRMVPQLPCPPKYPPAEPASRNKRGEVIQVGRSAAGYGTVS